MKNNNKLYCTDCKKLTKHTPKLSALMDGYMVCGECSKMNGFSRDVRWVEFDEIGSGKGLHEKPMVGYSLMMSPFGLSFTWMTTIVTEIIEEYDNYVHFKTENSEYKLYYNPQDVQESK